MPHYIRSCPICTKEFYSMRLNQNYCSKKCSNKARSFPPLLLQSLLEKASRALQVVPITPKVVRLFIEAQNSEIVKSINEKADSLRISQSVRDNLRLSGLSVIDQEAIFTEAKKLKEQREKENLEKEFSNENISHTNPDLNEIMTIRDEEMVGFKLHNDPFKEVLKDNIHRINKTDPASGNADGFKDVDTTEQPKSKLRRIGAK